MRALDAAYEGAPVSWVGGPVTFTLAHEGPFPRWIGRLAAIGEAVAWST